MLVIYRTGTRCFISEDVRDHELKLMGIDNGTTSWRERHDVMKTNQDIAYCPISRKHIQSTTGERYLRFKIM
jgi:hypothetical protein